MRTKAWTGSKSTGFPPTIRRAILTRDRQCQHCHTRPATQADHIIPVAHGGTHDPSNGQGLCAACHRIKTEQDKAAGRKRKQALLHQPTERHPGLTEQ